MAAFDSIVTVTTTQALITGGLLIEGAGSVQNLGPYAVDVWFHSSNSEAPAATAAPTRLTPGQGIEWTEVAERKVSLATAYLWARGADGAGSTLAVQHA